jgi:tetratricopeptide (TPR) repeat protein
MFGSWFSKRWLGKRRNPAETVASAGPPVDVDTNADALCAKARQHVIAGQPDAALVLLNRAVEIAPDAQTYADRGTVQAMLGQLEAAHADLQKAIAGGYRYAATYATLGTVLSNLQRLDEAHQAFDTAIDLDASYVFAHYNRAQLFAAQGATQAAVADLRVCLEFGPDAAFRARIEERLREYGVDPASLATQHP